MRGRAIALELLQIPTGTRFYMPDTGRRLPYVHNRFAAEVCAEAKIALRPQVERCVGAELADTILGQDDIGGWASFVYPLADRERLRLITELALIVLVYDDMLTRTAVSTDLDEVRRRVSRYGAVIRGERLSDERAVEQWARDAYERLHALIGAAQFARFQEMSQAINDSMVPESEHRASRVLPEWDTYLEFRRVNLYGFWVTFMAEVSVGVDMTVHLTRSAQLRAAESCAVDHVLYSNDLYSFAKEAKLGELANTFWILRRDGMSIQQAVDDLAGRLVRAQDDFIATRNNILAGALWYDDDVRRYLDALAHAMGGTLHFHRTSGRYFGPDYDGTPVFNGTVIIGEQNHTFLRDA